MSLSRNSRMIVVLAALVFPGRLFAQGTAADSAHAMIPVRADQLPIFLHPGTIHFAHPDQPMFVNARNVRALYVNAWAFASPKLWCLARLADSTEINALVVDVKDDTGCMLYPSQLPTPIEIGTCASALHPAAGWPQLLTRRRRAGALSASRSAATRRSRSIGSAPRPCPPPSSSARSPHRPRKGTGASARFGRPSLRWPTWCRRW